MIFAQVQHLLFALVAIAYKFCNISMVDSSPSSNELLTFITEATTEQAREVAELLAHQSEKVRAAAADALVEMGNDKAAQAVAGLVGNSNADVRVQLPDILAQIDNLADDHVQVIARLLSDQVPSVRVAALEVVPLLNEDSFSGMVVHSLSDNEADVRAAAANALGSLSQGGKDHADVIVNLLSDSVASVRIAALDSLGKMREVAAAHAFQVVALAKDDDWMVRGSVAKALATLGQSSHSYQTLLLDLLADSSVYVSRQAAQSLACLVSGMASKDLVKEIKVQTSWRHLLDDVPPQPVVRQVGKHEVWLCHNLLSKTECARIVGAAEGRGFGATSYPKDYRGNLRLITTDISLADALWGRLQNFVPTKVSSTGDEWEASGLNDCWRLSKYHPRDVFERHVDACFMPTYDESSMFTVNIYLNDGFAGGSTRFYFEEGDRDVADLAVTPEAGLCLLFRQPPGQYYDHDGEKVRSGLKYLLRSDVMYRRQVPC